MRCDTSIWTIKLSFKLVHLIVGQQPPNLFKEVVSNNHNLTKECCWKRWPFRGSMMGKAHRDPISEPYRNIKYEYA